MPQPKILRAKDVAEELKISESTAYKLIKQLNKELSAKGYITFAGRVSSKYFYEKIYGTSEKEWFNWLYLKTRIMAVGM